MEIPSLETIQHDTPQDASSKGCDWPVHSELSIDKSWTSGYYELELTDNTGQQAHHFVVVKNRRSKKNVLILATNTYHAYNYWGGFNAYADVASLMSGKLDVSSASARAIGELSTERPFTEFIVNTPDGSPRLVNQRKRQKDEHPFAIDPEFMLNSPFSPFDGSAGFVNKWEHKFVEWADTVGLEFDYLTDKDVEDPTVLNDYECIFAVGHSEYWSGDQRYNIDAFVEKGGNLIILSGNTCYWKVRHEPGRMVSHKNKGHIKDPLWSDIKTRPQATHLWCHPEFGDPEASTIGLSFLYGGYHRLGNCSSRGQGGFTVLNESHWAFAESDLFYGDVFGDELPLLGYESDGCPFSYDELGRLVAGDAPGVPNNLEILAYAPVTLCEASVENYFPLIPPEDIETIANIKYGSTSEEAIQASRFGHAVIATFEKGDGRVFNAGTTEWVHGLAAEDPFVTQITLNVLKQFGAI